MNSLPTNSAELGAGHRREQRPCSPCRGLGWIDEAGIPCPACEGHGHLRRVWRRRVKGWRMPENTVSVCRPGKWGNPFGVHPDDGGQAQAVELFSEWLAGCWPHTEPERRDWILLNLHTLRGRNLACYCKPGTPCHADVLLDLANDQTHPPA